MLRYQDHLAFFPVSKEETSQFRGKWHKVGFKLTKHWTSSQTQCEKIKEEWNGIKWRMKNEEWNEVGFSFRQFRFNITFCHNRICVFLPMLAVWLETACSQRWSRVKYNNYWKNCHLAQKLMVPRRWTLWCSSLDFSSSTTSRSNCLFLVKSQPLLGAQGRNLVQTFMIPRGYILMILLTRYLQS